MNRLKMRQVTAVFLSLLLVLGVFAAVPPAKASAASQYITNIQTTQLTGNSATVSFYYGKNAADDDTQTLFICLYDADKTEIQFKILRIVGFIDDNVNIQGTYSYTFTGLAPDTQYYFRINGNATLYSILGNTNRHYWSDYMPLKTVNPTNPTLNLTASDIRQNAFRIQGSVVSSGTGLPVNAAGIVTDGSGATAFTKYALTIRQGATIVKQTGDVAFSPGYSIFSFPDLFTGLSPSTSYDVTLSLTNSFGLTGSVMRTVRTPKWPTAYFQSGAINQPYTPSLHNIIFTCVVDIDAADAVQNITAVRYGPGGTEIFGRVVKPYDAGDKSIQFAFDNLASSTSYEFFINALCQSGYHSAIASKTYVTGPAPTAATVVTNPAEAIKTDRAKFTGEITANGNGPVEEHGFVYALNSTGHTADTLIIGGSGVTRMLVPLTSQALPIWFAAFPQSLQPGTGYDFRAYVRTAAGLQYGAIQTFSTWPAPAVTTGSSSGVTIDSATLAGNVTSTGGLSPTIRGFVLAQTNNPQLGGEAVLVTIDEDFSANTGAFSTEAAGLLPDTTYYYRAYVNNVRGVFYGSEQSFTTLKHPGTPTVKLGLVSVPQFNPGEKEVNATFTSPGGITVTGTGFVYALTENPVIGGPGVINHPLTDVDGSFAALLTGLSPSTTYYYKAYATDGVVTGYSSQGQFTTIAQITTGFTVPIISRTEVTAVGATTATVETEAKVTGIGLVVFSRRLAYSTSDTDPKPGEAGVTTVHAGFLGVTGNGATTTDLTGLAASSTYYLRCVTENAQGTDYGSVVTFITDAAGLPIIANGAPPYSQITQSSISVHAAINPNGATVTTYGVVYSASDPLPVLGDESSQSLAGAGSLSQITNVSLALTGLVGGTTYTYRIYAANSQGITYGPAQSISTTATVPPSIAPPANLNPSMNGIKMDVAADSDGEDWGALTKLGVLVGTTATPQLTDTDALFLSLDFTALPLTLMLSGLDADTVYYARSFGVSQDGTVHYGQAVAFTTLDQPAQTVPVVTADSYLPIFTDMARLFGSVLSDGGAEVTERGFVFATTASPEIGGGGVRQVVDSVAGTGAFSVVAADFERDTLYFVRAYAINETGTAYSEDLLMLLTDIADPDDELDDVPDTGDNSRLPVLPGLAALGVLTGCILLLRRRRSSPK